MIFLLKRMTIVLKKIQFLTRHIRPSVEFPNCLARNDKLTVHRPLKGSAIITTRLHLFRRWEALRERERWDGREREGRSSARALSATLSQSSCPGMAGDEGVETEFTDGDDGVLEVERKVGGIPPSVSLVRPLTTSRGTLLLGTGNGH